MILTTKLALLGGFVSSALAHGTVWGYTADGIYHENNHPNPEAGKVIGAAGWFSDNVDRGFVSTGDYQSPDIICHKNGRPSTHSAIVAAGGTVQFHWTPWPENHPGPVMTYVANCRGDCADVDKETLKWVKIDEVGVNEKTDEWAAIELIGTNNTWTTTVPETLVAGNYVFRHEILGIYGKQHYPSCLNVEVTGSGTEDPEGVIGTELYGIEYRTAEGDEYVIPGPAPYTPGASPAASTSSQPTSTASAMSTSATATAVSSATSVAEYSAVSSAVSSAAPVSTSSSAPASSATPTATPSVRIPCGSKKARRHARDVRQ